MRETTKYVLFTNWAANWTGKIAMSEDFRHLWLTIATWVSFTGTIKIKWTRIDNVDMSSAISQTNAYSYLQLTNNDTWTNSNGSTWIALSTSAGEVYDYAVNVDGFDYVTAEISWYTWWDVNVNIRLYNNQ